MKVKYNRENDVLMIEISDEKIDYAEEFGDMIIHFSKEGRPVLIEILDASEFLTGRIDEGYADVKIRYSPDADVLAIRFREGKPVDSIDVVEGVITHISEDDKMIEIEILDVYKVVKELKR